MSFIDLDRSDHFILLLVGPCPVFYSVCLFCCNIDVQLSHQYFRDCLGGPEVLGFPFLAIFANRLSFILFGWSLHARLLSLAHLMTSRRCCECLYCEFYLAECCQWCTLRSSFPSILVDFVSALVSMASLQVSRGFYISLFCFSYLFLQIISHRESDIMVALVGIICDHFII